MRLFTILSISFLVAPHFLNAQQSQDNLWNNKKAKFGFSLQGGISYWKQKNFNSKLNEHNLPQTPNADFTLGIGSIVQWNKVRVTLLALGISNKNSGNSNDLQQQFGGGEIDGAYFIIRKKSFSLSPQIGGGLLYGTTRIRSNSASGSFSDAVENRNTTVLFNRQGYLNVALNLGFDYSPRYKDHLFQLSVGYRFGFANTRWSTNPKKEIITGAPTDKLRQVYLALKMNFMFTNINNRE